MYRNKDKRQISVENETLTSWPFIAIVAAVGRLLLPRYQLLFSRICRVLSVLVSRSAIATVMLTGESRFSFYLGDFYWNRLIARQFQYEPEVAYLLSNLKHLSIFFIDCGANFGYWTISAFTAADLTITSSVAIEPNPLAVRFLERNVASNKANANTVIYPMACSEYSGEKLYLSGTKLHAGARITDHPSAIQVESISIDHILKKHFKNQTDIVVIKLDVEGHEGKVMSGAKALWGYEAVVIFEDHGADKLDTNVKMFQQEHGCDVFWCNPAGAISLVKDSFDMRKIKQCRSTGYNFVAVKRGSKLSNMLNKLSERNQ